ncbi:substrate-binding domain-containing protein [Bradyrhizobium japonicum]
MRKLAAIAAALVWSTCAYAQDRTITVASTTSTEQSGLFGYLLPLFSKAEGIEVKVVAVGTGQALDIGRRGDADVVFVHDRPAEDKFMSEGQGVKRFDVMYNDFIIVGPKSDPQRSPATRTSRMRCARSRRRGQPSSRAAISPARMRRS